MKSIPKEILSVCTMVLLTNCLWSVAAQGGLIGTFLDFADSHQPTGSPERGTLPRNAGLPPIPGVPNTEMFPNDNAFPPDPSPTNTAAAQDPVFPTDTPAFPSDNSPSIRPTEQSLPRNTERSAAESTRTSSSPQQTSGRSTDVTAPAGLGRLTASLLIPRHNARRNEANTQRVQGTNTQASNAQVSKSSPPSNTNENAANRNIDTSSGTDTSKLFPFLPNFPRGSRVINLQSGRTRTFDPLSFMEASGLLNAERRQIPSVNPVAPTSAPRMNTRPAPTNRPVMASGMAGADARPVIASGMAGADARPVIASGMAGADARPVIASGMASADARPVIASGMARADARPVMASGMASADARPVMASGMASADARPVIASGMAGADARPVIASGMTRAAAPASRNLQQLVRQSLGSFGRDRSLYQALRNRRNRSSRALRNK